MRRRTFVKYTFVPGLGFYDIGLLHILGNTTNAITAAWRELLDAGMYSNFPGFLMADTGGRQNTNIFRVPPGGGALVKTGGMPISQAIMPLPYQPPSQALMALVDNMATTGQRIGGTSEQQVGEGKSEAPVGTTLAMIEQATKIMNSVHKRLHASQSEEFKLIVDCFKENPQCFWQHGCRSKTQWDEQTFNEAVNNCELVPQADPNTASHAQRVMKIMALKQLQQANPSMYDPIAIDTAALQAMGWNNPQQFFASPSAQQQVPPEVQQMIAKVQNEKQAADAKMVEAKAKEAQARASVAESQAKIAQGHFAPKQAQAKEQPDNTAATLSAQARLMDAQTKRQELDIKHHDNEDESQNRILDRHSREKMQEMELMRDLIMHQTPTADALRDAEIAKKASEDS